VAAIDEPDCDDGSYGFRQGRSPHAALQELRQRGRTEGRGGSVEAEVSGSCDRIASTRRRAVVRQRGNEGRMLRLMGQWRRAGVGAHGALRHPATGVGQGGGIAPGWANVCLHQVLDAWLAREGRPRLQGRGFRMRCADDCVIGCARAGDARKVLAVLPQRLARRGRTLHPTPTTVMACRKPEAHAGSDSGNGPCDVLGLTHAWTQSRPGFWGSTRRPASKRRRRTTESLWRWCRTHRHAPLQYQSQMLGSTCRGHCQDDGMRGHVRLVEEGRRVAEKAWRYGLRRRRSTKAMGWEQCEKLMQTSILPIPRIVHTI
jgi:RNA-directed DNA polymerase